MQAVLSLLETSQICKIFNSCLCNCYWQQRYVEEVGNVFTFCYLNSCRSGGFFLLDSYVSQETILEVTVSNPCVCGQLGVTGVSTYVPGRGRVTILRYFVTD